MQAERPEIFELLERQSRWQKSRRDLSWPEKVRMAEKVRAAAAKWGQSTRKSAENKSDAPLFVLG